MCAEIYAFFLSFSAPDGANAGATMTKTKWDGTLVRMMSLAAAAMLLLTARADAQNRWMWNHTHDDARISVNVTGDVQLTPDDRAIAQLSPGGRLQIEEEKRGQPSRLVIVSSPRDGGLEYVYVVDGRNRSWDAEAQAWFSALLVRLAPEWGQNVEQRVQRVHASGGAAAVLDLVEGINSSSSRRAHLLALLDLGPLNEAQGVRMLRIVGSTSSTSGRAQLLRTLSDRLDLRRAPLRDAYFSAAEGITSSSAKRGVLVHLLERDRLDPAILEPAMNVAATITSSSERRAVLVAAAERQSLSGERVRTAFFRSVDGISSSSERRLVLVTVLDRHGDDAAVVRDVVRSAAQISSDSEKAAVLMRVPVRQLRDSATSNAYRNAIDTVRSSSSRQRLELRLAEARG
jgi:hypothetical protein